MTLADVMRELRVYGAGEPVPSPVLPLWIDGHAYVTVTPAFGEVKCARSGQVLRRFPLCGEAEVRRALDSALAAQPLWAAFPEGTRRDCLRRLGETLAGYVWHFSALLSEECACELAQAEAELNALLALLREPPEGPAATLAAVAANASQPLLSPLKLALPVLLTGGVVIVLTSPAAPSVLVAFAELTGRSGLPAGVLSLLHGDRSTWESLDREGVSRLPPDPRGRPD